MLSVEESREYLPKDLTDEQIRDIRDSVYAVLEKAIDKYLEDNGRL